MTTRSEKSVMVCGNCMRKLAPRIKPDSLTYNLFIVSDNAHCGICRDLIVDVASSKLLHLGSRKFSLVYKPMPSWVAARPQVVYTPPSVWTSDNTTAMPAWWTPPFG